MKRRSEKEFTTSPIKRSKSEKNVSEQRNRSRLDREEKPRSSSSKTNDSAGEGRKELYQQRWVVKEEPKPLKSSLNHNDEDIKIHHSSLEKGKPRCFLPKSSKDNSDKDTQKPCSKQDKEDRLHLAAKGSQSKNDEVTRNCHSSRDKEIPRRLPVRMSSKNNSDEDSQTHNSKQDKEDKLCLPTKSFKSNNDELTRKSTKGDTSRHRSCTKVH